MAAAADVVVMVTRPEVGAVMHLKDRLERLARCWRTSATPRRWWCRWWYAEAEAGAVVDELGRMLAPSSAARVIAGIGWVAFDVAGVEAMYAGQVGGKNARLPLLRSAGVLNDLIDQAAGVGPYTAGVPVDDAYAGHGGVV